jgi:hypothetical protein
MNGQTLLEAPAKDAIGLRNRVGLYGAYFFGKGKHRLAVRVEGERSGQQEIDFALDQTGRYTAVPMVHPIVLATNFC